MKKLILLFLSLLVLSAQLSAQFINETRIDSVVNLVSIASLSKNLRELTGDTTTTIGGSPYLIYSRYSLSPANPKAAQYLFEKFQSFGLSVRYQVGDTNSVNVIARKTGTRFPNQKIVIGAHYDNIIWPVLPQPLDTVHGADDDGSGIVALLEMARLTAGMSFEYTIEFAAWDNEEIGLYGSRFYSDSAYINGDSIKTYINIDMIAYNYLNTNTFHAGGDSNSVFFNSLFNVYKTRYIPNYNLNFKNASYYGSDNNSFINNKFRTFCLSEYQIGVNPNYHKLTDNFENANMTYCRDVIKPIFGMLMTLAGNKNAFFDHKPLASTYDTTSRNLWTIIKFPNGLPSGAIAPRMYYKINTQAYSYTTAYYSNNDTFKFTLPGIPKGSGMKYYFAAQDSTGSFACTYPVGGNGINPPGSSPPANTFVYSVYNNLIFCSETLPKPINDMQYTYDTIQVNSAGYINKIMINLSLNHTNDGDLVIQLLGQNGVVLSQRNGNGGQNYINTTFDDTASLSITQGTPPFTGTFRPQTAFTAYFDKPAAGKYILRIFDAATGNTGSLTSWCLQIETKMNVGIQHAEVPLKYELSQNYPNPFNSTSNIRFSIAKMSSVRITVYDMLGRQIQTLVNEVLQPGTHKASIDASMLSSGVYFYRMEAGDFTDTKRMILLR
ncbi:MAG: M28 family peptidase [Candidatus Kapaibacterium sp.]